MYKIKKFSLIATISISLISLCSCHFVQKEFDNAIEPEIFSTYASEVEKNTIANSEEEEPSDYDFNNEKILEEGKYHKIVEYDSYQYRYYIYNESNEIVGSGDVDRITPKISMLNNDVIEINWSMGVATSFYRYYSIKREVFSRDFLNVTAYSNELIAYGDGFYKKLIVRNVFDKQKYYREFDINFSKAIIPILKAEFINDNKQIHIVYVAGEEYIQNEKTIDLN